MKISKLFHWLYAAIMFLPLLIAPIFAIYSHRHTIDSYQVTRDKYQVVDFNQEVQNGNFENGLNYWSLYNPEVVSYTTANNTLTCTILDNSRPRYEYAIVTFLNDVVVGHKYLIKYVSTSPNNLFVAEIGATNTTSDTTSNFENGIIIECLGKYNNQVLIYPNKDNTYNVNDTYSISNVNLFDLTKMFGLGNEPSVTEFNNIYNNDYYEYTTSKKELIKFGTETLNNTDIGSQFVYAIYNPLNDYFNFNKFLGIGNLYNWMQLNLFKGTAPLGFFIFWELLMYWLLISLIWLIFDVAMYVPKLAHRWLDKASLE